jgi:ring-1,2-phenylacetyl-CoA epoxidase subunit PaaC
MTMIADDTVNQAYFDYLLRIGDASLVLGQRLSEWCGHGPVLEEDIALANTALDLLGQARLLLTHAGRIEGQGRDEDALAFMREERDYRNPSLVELPNEDFARTVLRNFLFTSFQSVLWRALAASSDAELAAIAAKSAKETRYHQGHSADWTVRLGDGTVESQARMQRALVYLWPYTAELFAPNADDAQLGADGRAVAWSSLRPAWEAIVLPVLAQAQLTVPAATPFLSHGTQGVHTEHLGHLLTTLQYLQRAYPGGRW